MLNSSPCVVGIGSLRVPFTTAATCSSEKTTPRSAIPRRRVSAPPCTAWPCIYSEPVEKAGKTRDRVCRSASIVTPALPCEWSWGPPDTTVTAPSAQKTSKLCPTNVCSTSDYANSGQRDPCRQSHNTLKDHSRQFPTTLAQPCHARGEVNWAATGSASSKSSAASR